MKPIPMHPELDRLTKEAVAKFKAMTPDEKEALHKKQMESYVRAELDWNEDHLPEERHPMAARVEIDYTNFRGERGRRIIEPIRVWFGTTTYHPHPCWMVTALDVDRQVVRDFAIKDIHSWVEQGGAL